MNRNLSPSFSGAVAVLHMSVLQEVKVVRRRQAELSSFVLLCKWG